MRRVWYVFFVQKALHPYTTHGAVLFFAILALTHFIHVMAIAQNIANIRVGDLGQFMISALTGTEIVNILLLGVIMMAILSLRFRLPKLHRRQLV